MQPLDFLAAVLPSSGFYCVAELTTKKKEHVYVNDLQGVATTADLFELAERDTYFALASFREPGSRLAANAEFVRALFVDVDCGKGKKYATKKDAVAALDAFLKATQLDALGQPWLVDSGGGLHIYWPFEEEVPVDTWRPVAEAFKRLCREQDFRIDMTVTADCARVLRVPGTTNRKYPKPVQLKLRGDTFDFIVLQQAIGVIEPVQTVAPVLQLPGLRPKQAPTATGVKLIENSTTYFKDIMVRTVAGTGCGQLLHYVENAQEDGMEPLWRGLLSIAKVCDDGMRAAEKLSAMHPYPVDRMHQKLREIKGPYSCVKLDSENPGVCPGCPHWGRITNPLALGRAVLTSVEEKTFEVPQTPEKPAAKYVRPTPPRGFSYGTHGGIFRDKETEDGDGQKVMGKILVLPYDMFVVDIMHIEGVHTAHMVALRPDGAKDITLPTKAIVSKDETVKTLAEQNIIAAFGAGNDKNLFEFVRGCVEEASTQKPPTLIPTQYGWQPDHSFVFNGKILLPDGTVREVPMDGLENITASTQPKGSLETWRSIVNLLISRKMTDVLAHGCIGFGAPLMCFTGIRGMTFHAGHKESGTGKSLALSLVASIWGNPVDYRTGKSTSPVAMQQRAGNLNSLPFVCDELTMKARADTEWFPAFVFDFSEGRGKERMEAGANRERINTSTWNTIALFTSNTRMLDYMTGVRQHSSEGELRRFLEWSPSEKLEFNEDELRTLLQINANYGVAGDVYARWLVTNRSTAQAVVQEVKENLFKEYKATNDERFWIAGVAAIVAGAILAGSKHANVVDLPVKSIVECFRKLIEKAREAIKGSAMSAEDLLNDFTREFYGQFIVIRKSAGGLLAALGSGDTVDHSITRSKVAGRIEHEMSPGWVDFFIEEQVMKRHCAVFGFGFTDFKEELERKFKVSYGKKDMLSGTKGPAMRVNAMKISRRTGEADEI